VFWKFTFEILHAEPRLTLAPLTWRIWWDPNNASRWQMGFNSAFKGLKYKFKLCNAHLWKLMYEYVWLMFHFNNIPYVIRSRSQWPRSLRHSSVAARLLRFWVWIPPGAWMFVCCECCTLSGRGLCDELITRPEESYWLLCVVVCDLETSWMRRLWPIGKGGCCASPPKSNL